MKKNKTLLLLILLFLIFSILLLIFNYYHSENDNNLNYKLITYQNINDDNYHQSLFSSLAIDEEYIIIDSYSDYESLYNDIINSGYVLDGEYDIDKNFFLNSTLVIIDNYMSEIAKYDADIKDLNYENDILNVTLCVDYYSASIVGGFGSLTFIEINNQNVNKVDLDIEANNTRTNFEVEDKPVIYLYPEEEIELTVTLGAPELITCIYPQYQNNWNVIVKPDGTIIDKQTNKMYYSLYYESINIKSYSNNNMKEGFVVSRDDLVNFLEEKLELLGLNYKEKEEFIIYWLPKLKNYRYVYIRFQTMEEIEANMPLIISKEPDTLIRIMMEWKGLDEIVDVIEQELNLVTRSGFTVVEWGGTQIK